MKFVRLSPALIVIAALSALQTGWFIRFPFADGDLFWQRSLGEYVLAHHAVPQALGNDVFSAPGAPWVPQEWLFSTVVALAFAHGALWIVAVITGFLLALALTIVAWRALRAGASSAAIALAAFFAAICVSSSFALRAEVWVWPLFALALLVLDLDGPALWWLIPVVVLWANLHASVMIVVPIVWLNTAIYAWSAQRSAARATQGGVRTRLLLCVIVPLATLCTPFGIHLPIYAMEVLHSPLRAYISQWHPITATYSVRYGFVPLVVLAVVALFRRVWATRPFDIALALGFGVLSCFAARDEALFAFVAVVPAALGLGPMRPVETIVDRVPRSAVGTIAGLLIVVAFFGWLGIRLGSPWIQWPAPFGSVEHLAALPGEHRLFCAEYSWCSVALDTPNVRIFLDGRADPYPPSVWAAHAEITRARPGWQQLMASYDINAVIAWRGGFFESQMKTLPQWNEIIDTNDACCVLFVKN